MSRKSNVRRKGGCHHPLCHDCFQKLSLYYCMHMHVSVCERENVRECLHTAIEAERRTWANRFESEAVSVWHLYAQYESFTIPKLQIRSNSSTDTVRKFSLCDPRHSQGQLSC